MLQLAVPGAVKEIVRKIQVAGYQAFIVGGAVRDALLRRPTSDFDVATDALPADIQRLFKRVAPTGIKHGTVTVIFHGWSVEITTFRAESQYSDGRRPDTVVFGTSVTADLGRRDFSMNAIAYDPISRRVVDPFGGRSDIAERRIRTVGPAEHRFAEDALRLLRAVRFVATLGFDLDPDVTAALLTLHDRIAVVSPERVRQELAKMITGPAVSRALAIGGTSGLLADILPELAATIGFRQGCGDHNDLFDHLVATCAALPVEPVELRLAGLLHDIGKPATAATAATAYDQRLFADHEKVSAALADGCLRRLRFSTAERNEVVHLVARHMDWYSPDWSDAAVRRFLVRVGRQSVPALVKLQSADAYAKTAANTGKPAPLLERFAGLAKRIAALSDDPLTTKDLAINGNQLAVLADVPKGPSTGVVLAFLLEAVLDDPSLNTTATLATLGRSFYRTRVCVSPPSSPASVDNAP